MDTVTYPESRVAEFIVEHFVPAQVRLKDNRQLVEDYVVAWTPDVLITDEHGKVHYRVEGYLPPEPFLARLSLGLGRYWLNRKQFVPALQRFDEVHRRHSDTDAGAEALYWLGIAHYKESHDAALLRPSWQQLAQEYPNTEWAERTRIPAKSE